MLVFCAHYQNWGKSASGRVLVMEAHHRQTHPERSKAECESVYEPYRTATEAEPAQQCLMLPDRP